MSYNHLLLFHLWFLIPVAYKQLPSPMITLQLKKLDVLRSCFSIKNQLLLQLRMIYIDCFSSKGRDVYQNRSNFSSPRLHCSKVVPWLFDLWMGIFRERRAFERKCWVANVHKIKHTCIPWDFNQSSISIVCLLSEQVINVFI